MVDTDAHARAGVPLGAALANNDVAGDDVLTTELLDAETTASGIATIAGRAACFLVCHSSSSLFLVSLGGGLFGRRLLGCGLVALVGLLGSGLLGRRLLGGLGRRVVGRRSLS